MILHLLLTSTSVVAQPASPFVHPGVLVSNRQLDVIRHQVLVQKSGPMYEAYTKALNSTFASKTFAPFGPPACGIIVCGSYSKPNIGCSNESSDVATAYLQSLLWAIDGNPVYAANAIAALNAYASHLHGYGGVKACVADSHYNAPLQAAWSGMMYSKAAELLAHAESPQGTSSGWAKADQQRLKTMLTNVTVPLIYAGSGANGNWELSMLDALIGIAVFTDNRTMFNHAIAFWRQRVPGYFWVASDGPFPVQVPRDHEQWNGSGFGSGTFYGQVVLNASTAGVCQETCRDFGHLQMGMASSMYTAETAFVQGVDLWTEQAPRFAAAMEFHSKFLNAGKEAPVPPYMCSRSPDHPGGVTLAYAPTMEVGFNAVAVRLKMALPHTETHLKKSVRAMADPSNRWMMYETLTHGDAFAADATNNTNHRAAAAAAAAAAGGGGGGSDDYVVQPSDDPDAPAAAAVINTTVLVNAGGPTPLLVSPANGYLTVISRGSASFRALGPAGGAPCGVRTKTSATAAANGCRFATNGGPFNMTSGACDEGVFIVNGEVHGTGGWKAPMFGVTGKGEWVIGVLNASLATSLNVTYALSGFYWLVRDGVNVVASNSTYVAPRTAVGTTATGKLLFLEVDGCEQQSGCKYNLGKTNVEMAELLLKHGAHNAINLDGGGSSTVCGPDGKVLNFPTSSDQWPVKIERAVTTITCVV